MAPLAPAGFAGAQSDITCAAQHKHHRARRRYYTSLPLFVAMLLHMTPALYSKYLLSASGFAAALLLALPINAARRASFWRSDKQQLAQRAGASPDRDLAQNGRRPPLRQ